MEVDLKEPQIFSRSAPNSLKLKEANPCTQTEPHPHAYSGPVYVATNNEYCGSLRQVAQDWMNTMSDIDPYTNLAQVDPELTQPMVSLRPHQSSTQLATEAVHPKGILKGTSETENNSAYGRGRGQPMHSGSYTVIEVYLYSQPTLRVNNSTHEKANSIQGSTTIGGCI